MNEKIKSDDKDPQDNKSTKIDSAIEKIAEKNPKKLVEMMSLQAISGVNPIHQKVNETHITQVLEIAKNHDERDFKLTDQAQRFGKDGKDKDRWLYGLMFFVVVGLIVLVLFLFKDNPQVLIPILTGMGGMVTGFLGGWGFGKASK